MAGHGPAHRCRAAAGVRSRPWAAIYGAVPFGECADVGSTGQAAGSFHPCDGRGATACGPSALGGRLRFARRLPDCDQRDQAELIPLDEQDRTRWDRAQIAEGTALVSRAFARGQVGSYQLQAAIAAVHAEAPDVERTDWPQIEALYTVLAQLQPGPVVALNRAVAVAMVHGPRAGLAELDRLATDPQLAAGRGRSRRSMVGWVLTEH